ncbi:alginate lyase family protein [Phycisphaeraceae bacterium D3-23]
MRDGLRQLRRAATMPPGELLAKVRRKLRGRQTDARQRRRDATRSTYRAVAEVAEEQYAPLARLIDPVDTAMLLPHREAIAELARRALAHEFDLLGSGWTHVVNTHGLEVSEPNRAEAERTLSLLPDGYTPIDWHIDFKSAAKHRWDARVWYRDQPQVVGQGIDVKLPWELARMQHLPMLAWGYALANNATDESDAMPAPAERYLAAFRNQVLDFIAHNPPRFGVNWNCAMDVGIRVAGWVLTFDLFRALGAVFDAAFTRVFARSVREHADHLAANLEWDETVRGNHYLADVAGLLIASAYLPADDTADAYLHFASRELVAETLRQFHEDGSNFEASTSYHRLSAEMVVYGLAVLQRATQARRTALTEDQWLAYRPGEPSPVLQARRIETGETVIPESVIDRLARLARFTDDILDRHGRDPQIGDNDSGRFFKLLPAVMHDSDGTLREDLRNHRHLIDAVDGWFKAGTGPASHNDTPQAMETSVVRAILGNASFKRPEPASCTEQTAYSGMGLFLYKHGRLTTIVRCGEVGQDGNGGHAHDDQLSFVLYVDGEPIVIDPGTGCYTSDPTLRDKMRHVARHNAVSIDNGVRRYAQLRRDGLFRMPDRARSQLLGHSNTGLVGQHRLFGTPTQREFRCWPNELEVGDLPTALAGRYAVLHLAAGVAVTREGGAIMLRKNDIVLRLTISHDAPIEIDCDVYSASYGEPLVESPRLTYRLYGPAQCVCSIVCMKGGA